MSHNSGKIANSIFTLEISSNFPAILIRIFSLNISRFFSVVTKNMRLIGSTRSFKYYFCPPKSNLNVQIKVKLPNMTDWRILPGLKIDVFIACRRQSVSHQNVECVSRYIASGHLQITLQKQILLYLHPQNPQPCKSVTL